MRKVILPKSMEELWEAIWRHPGCAVYCGGTDLLVRLKKGLLGPASLLCLEGIDSLKGIYESGEDVFIGACTTHTRIMADPIIRGHFPILVMALSRLGSPHIRNMGTIGGNIVTASPAGDSLPPLYLLEARVEILSRDNKRSLPIKDFIKGPGRTDLREGEIVKGVWINKVPEFNLCWFEKIGQRNALAISIASLAAMLRLSPQNEIEEIRLAFGSVGPTVVRSREVEEHLQGRTLCLDALEGVLELIYKVISPIDDIRASREYRSMAAGNMLLRLLNLPAQSNKDLSLGL